MNDRSSFTLRDLRRLCIIGVILAVIYVWSSIWTDLRTYENNTPEIVLKEFVAELNVQASKGSCSELLEKCRYKINFSSLNHAGQILAERLRNKNVELTPVVLEDGSEVPDLYYICADGEAVARISVGVSGHYGMLRLNRYEILSLDGVISAEFAVNDPSGKSVLDVSMDNLLPSASDYVNPHLAELANTHPELSIPSYYIYRLEGLFAIPKAYLTDDRDAECPVFTAEDGTQIIEDAAYIPTEEIRNELLLASEEYADFLSGDTNWDAFKGRVESTVPFYEDVQKKYKSRFAKQTYSELEDWSVVAGFKWNENLISAEVAYKYTVSAPGGDITYNDNNMIYLYRNDDSLWQIIQIVDLNADPDQADEEDEKDGEGE